MFKLTRDGFSILVMGFTGQKAYEWKVQFIDAFNKMEKIIRGHDKNMPILADETHSELMALIANDGMKTLREINIVKRQTSEIQEYIAENLKPKKEKYIRAGYTGQTTKYKNLAQKHKDEVAALKEELREIQKDFRIIAKENTKLSAKLGATK